MLRVTSSTALLALVAVLAALVSPLVLASSAQAADEYTGDGYGYGEWRDETLASGLRVGVPYSSTVQAPVGFDVFADYFFGIDYLLPAGLSASLDGLTGVVTVSGTPTAAAPEANLSIWFYGPENEYYGIDFYDVVIDAAPTSSTVTATAASFLPYTSVTLVAYPEGIGPTGTVEFLFDGEVVGTAAVDPSLGTATYTGAVDASFVGATVVFSTHYLGDYGNLASSSTANPSVFIYGSRDITGSVLDQYGDGVETTVQLINAAGIPVDYTDSAADGMFSFTLAAPTTLAEATATYRLATLQPVYFSDDAIQGGPDVTDITDATSLEQSSWGASSTIYVTGPAHPDLSLVLEFAAGDAPGALAVDGSGLLADSAYTLYLHSTPVLLFSGTVDSNGTFSQTVTLPANTPVGAHELILTGIAPDGSVLTARAWFTMLPNGRIGSISYAGPITFELAATGSDPLVPLGVAGALLLAGFLAKRRRRSQQA